MEEGAQSGPGRQDPRISLMTEGAAGVVRIRRRGRITKEQPDSDGSEISQGLRKSERARRIPGREGAEQAA